MITKFSSALLLLDASKLEPPPRKEITKLFDSEVVNSEKSSRPVSNASRDEEAEYEYWRNLSMKGKTLVDPPGERLVLRVDPNNDFVGNFGLLRKKVYANEVMGAEADLRSKVVVATTLAEKPGEKWQRLLDDAAHQVADLVRMVIEANSKFHTIDAIDYSRTDGDRWAFEFANRRIDSANYWRDRVSRTAEQELRSSSCSPFMEYVSKDEKGEYKISAFQVKTKDGKLLSELKENGHYVTYKEDGSVLRELNRSDFCAEYVHLSQFALAASLAYRDDEDFQFY